jgi:putative ABC transport system permease protein
MWWLCHFFGLFFSFFLYGRRLRNHSKNWVRTNVLLKELSKQYIFFCAIGFVIGVVPAYLLLENGSKIFAYRITIQIFPLQLLSVF